MFVYVPATFPWTRTENVQVVVAPPGRAPPLKLIVFSPALAVTIPVIVPVEHEKAGTLGGLGLAITRPSGNVSVKLTPVTAPAFVLPMVKVSVLYLADSAGGTDESEPMLAGEKLLASVGGVGRSQPKMVTSSSMTAAAGLLEAAPVWLILNVVVLVPVAVPAAVTSTPPSALL